MNETDDKVDRLARLAREMDAGGVLLATQHNFSWMTGGRSNRIDASRETGGGMLLVGANGRRFVLANAIEMPRLLGEALAGLGFEAIEFGWAEERGDPSLVIGLARDVAGGGAIVADWPLAGVGVVEPAIARARALLTDAEVFRYRALGRDAGTMLGGLCRTLRPGVGEREIARLVNHQAAGIGGRAIVTLVGADERIARYRHPVPTDVSWQHLVMIAVCVERDGLVVALSRLVAAGEVPPDLRARTCATASVFGALLSATRPGATGREIFQVAALQYERVGFPGEERRHHQGGATGYRSREWVAHPACEEVVQAQQAFAWNPTITGTKIEETALVLDDRVEIITGTPGWPSIEIDVRGRVLQAPAILESARS